jgi:cysteine synthase B
MTLLDYRITESKILDVDGLPSHVGDTPLLPLRRLRSSLSPRTQIFAKAEWFNPGGSVKDRPALNIIQTALANGELGTGKRLLDATSGNMGISYATFGAALGIPVTLTIPASASPERFSILRTLGAELILTDPLEGSDGAILKARELAAEKPGLYWYANQYNNDANLRGSSTWRPRSSLGFMMSPLRRSNLKLRLRRRMRWSKDWRVRKVCLWASHPVRRQSRRYA